MKSENKFSIFHSFSGDRTCFWMPDHAKKLAIKLGIAQPTNKVAGMDSGKNMISSAISAEISSATGKL